MTSEGYRKIHGQWGNLGQHVGLQTDDAATFYQGLGFRPQPEFLSAVVGAWLDNQGNR